MRGKEIFNMSEVFNNNEFTSEPSQQSSNSYPYSFEQPFDAQQQPFAAQPQPSAPVPEQKKKSGKAGKIVALLLACALVGGGSGFGAAALMQKNAAAQPQSTTQTSSDASVMLEAKRQAAALQVASVDTGKVLTPSEVYAQNVNSTVGITTSITTNYFGYQTTSAAAGSGFILTADGYILTNYHVIENSNSVKVTMYDGTTMEQGIIMLLGLSKIMQKPDSVLPFHTALDLHDLQFGGSFPVQEPVSAEGTVRNTAGVLVLEAVISTNLHAVCDRCAAPFERRVSWPVHAVLTRSLEREDEADEWTFLLQEGDMADLDEILTTAFVLNMDSKLLCRPDCKGICPRCGKNLNEGACSCRPEIDPRLAVLGQLLKDK